MGSKEKMGKLFHFPVKTGEPQPLYLQTTGSDEAPLRIGLRSEGIELSVVVSLKTAQTIRDTLAQLLTEYES